MPRQDIGTGNHVELQLSQYFSDPDGDALTYRATSSDALVAGVSVSGSQLTVRAVSRGVAEARVTARDGNGGEARQTFEVRVPNGRPVAVAEIASRMLEAGEAEVLDASDYFRDPDGDPLTYAATSSDAAVAVVSVAGSHLTVGAVSSGAADVTVTAHDNQGGEARLAFDVVVGVTACVPMPEGALHWWAGDGTGADRIGGANATLMGGATYLPGVVTSRGGEAFSFDGVDAIGRVSDVATLNPTGPFSIMAWARPGARPTPAGTILGKGHPWAESWILDSHRGSWRAVMRDGRGAATTIYGTTLRPNVWAHVVMTWDGRGLSLYVDGQLDGWRSIASINLSDAFVGIGGRSEQGFRDSELDYEFAGEIDEIVFFGRALGEPEIRAVFAASTQGICKT